MKRTYEVYYRVGNEPLKFDFCMYGENDGEIIKAIAKLITQFAENTQTENDSEKVVCEWLVKYGERRVFNAIF